MKDLKNSIIVALIFMVVILLSILTLKSAEAEISYDDDIQCLTEALYYEARGEPTEGIIAVKKVILNRVADSRWPSTICSVVHQPNQFSYTKGAYLSIIDNEVYSRMNHIARLEHPDNSDFYKATHYVNPNLANPIWLKELVFIKTIGNHSFYK